MKEFKVIIETIDCISVQAESAEAALDQIRQQTNPRMLGGPIRFQVLEVEPEADASANT